MMMNTWRNLSTTQRISVILLGLVVVLFVVDEDLMTAVGLLLAALAIYFVPTILAQSRQVPNRGPVFVINLFLGWTLIGWVVALAMAVRDVPQDAEKPLDP